MGFKETAAPARRRLTPHLRPFPALAEVGVRGPRPSPGCVLVEAPAWDSVCGRAVTRTSSSRGTFSLRAWFSVAKKRTAGVGAAQPSAKMKPHGIVITKPPACLLRQRTPVLALISGILP